MVRARSDVGRRAAGARLLTTVLAALLTGSVLASPAAALGTAPTVPTMPTVPTAPSTVAAATAAVCTPGTMYAVTSGGTVHQITADGARVTGSSRVAQLRSSASGGSFNSLAVSPDGTTFYAVERYTSFLGTAYVDVVRHGDGASRVLQSGYRVSSASTIAGAVDPATGDYYFGVSEPGEIVVHRYPAGGGGAQLVGSLATHERSAVNGDFAFDALGNLYVITSLQGSSRVFTVPVAELRGDRTITPSAVSDNLTNATGSVFNGIAFSPVTYAFASTSTSIAVFDPNTMAAVTSPYRLGFGDVTDLASCQTPSTLALQKDVESRANATDQFTLEILRGEGTQAGSLGAATTRGSSTGLQQDAVVGPVPAVGGATYLVRERGSGTTDLTDYDVALRCTDTTGATVATQPTATPGTYRLVFPAVGANDPGHAVVCTFTNSHGTYAVTKAADPASGTEVQPGARIGYSVEVTADGGAARGVVLTDDLADVLDDATFVAGSARLTVAGGAPTAVADPTGTTLTSPAIDLAAGQRATLSYAVEVRGDAWSATLRNVVTGTDGRGRPPATCTADAPCATEHTTPAAGTYAVAKSAEPASGTQVQPGAEITYTVETVASDGPVRSVVLTDDLTDVLDDATFVAGSARLTVAGGEPVAVPDPDGTTLTSPAFDLAADETAALTYTVRVRDDAWSAALRNVVTAVDGRDVPPTTCTDDAPCATEHETPSKVLLEKVGESVEGTWVPMDGSAWALRSDDDGRPGAVLDAHEVTAVAGQPGRFELTGVPAGTYWLEETRAPAGFSLLAEPVRLTLAADGTVTLDGPADGVATATDDDGDGVYLVTVRDVPALELPDTGGSGPGPYLAAGTVLLAGAGALTLRLRRRP